MNAIRILLLAQAGWFLMVAAASAEPRTYLIDATEEKLITILQDRSVSSARQLPNSAIYGSSDDHLCFASVHQEPGQTNVLDGLYIDILVLDTRFPEVSFQFNVPGDLVRGMAKYERRIEYDWDTGAFAFVVRKYLNEQTSWGRRFELAIVMIEPSKRTITQVPVEITSDEIIQSIWGVRFLADGEIALQTKTELLSMSGEKIASSRDITPQNIPSDYRYTRSLKNRNKFHAVSTEFYRLRNLGIFWSDEQGLLSRITGMEAKQIDEPAILELNGLISDIQVTRYKGRDLIAYGEASAENKISTVVFLDPVTGETVRRFVLPFEGYGLMVSPIGSSFRLLNVQNGSFVDINTDTGSTTTLARLPVDEDLSVRAILTFWAE